MSFETVREFKYLRMLAKNASYVICVKPMPKNALGYFDLCILPVRPLPQKCIY
jgi:hypothetical protein